MPFAALDFLELGEQGSTVRKSRDGSALGFKAEAALSLAVRSKRSFRQYILSEFVIAGELQDHSWLAGAAGLVPGSMGRPVMRSANIMADQPSRRASDQHVGREVLLS